MRPLKQMLLIAAMLLGINAWAEDATKRVTVITQLDDVETTATVGTVTPTIDDKTVTITVTPKDGYYFANGDLTVEPVTDAGNAQARRRTAPDAPGYASGPTVTPGSGNTVTGTSTFTFDLDESDDKICYLVTANFHQRISLTGATVTVNGGPWTYSGTAKTPTVTVKMGTETLTLTTDYTVSYSNNVNIGTATITVTGNDKYSGDATKTFNIDPATITVSGITAEDKIYDGKKTATFNYSNVVLNGMVAGDNLSVTATGKFVTPDVGTDKPVTITELTLTGTSKDNYTLASSGNQSSTKGNITQKRLTVIAEPHTISFGDEPSNNGVTYEGFVNNENEEVLTGELQFAYNQAVNESRKDYVAGSPVGIYYIIPSGLGSSNYSFKYIAGVLTVAPKDIDYEGGTITQDEHGYTVNLTEDTDHPNGDPLPSDANLAKLTYSRTLAAPGSGEGDVTINGQAANLYTICLPFAPKKDKNVKYYTLASVTGETVNYKEVKTPASNTPYLIAVMGNVDFTEECTDKAVSSMTINSTTVDGYTFTGTFTGLTNTQALGKYILQSGNKWGKVTADKPNAYIPPFRAYIDGPANSARLLAGNLDGEATGIQYIRTTDADGTEQWYDLNGRRIDRPTKKGLYIHNGRKEAVK